MVEFIPILYKVLLSAHRPLSSFAYPMITHTPLVPVSGNFFWLLGIIVETASLTLGYS